MAKEGNEIKNGRKGGIKMGKNNLYRRVLAIILAIAMLTGLVPQTMITVWATEEGDKVDHIVVEDTPDLEYTPEIPDAPDIIVIPILRAGEVVRTSHTDATVRFTSDVEGQCYYNIGSAVQDTKEAGEICDLSEQKIEVAELKEGEQVIYIVVEDGEGNVSSDLFTITIPEYVEAETRDEDIINNFSRSGFSTFAVGNVYAVLKSDGKLYETNEDNTEPTTQIIVDKAKVTHLYGADDVTSIGSFVISELTSLTTVEMPKVTTIGSYTFEGCTSLTTVEILGEITIGAYAFQNCTALITVNMPEVKIINVIDEASYIKSSSVFEGCTSLNTVNMPKVTAIGVGEFYGCTSLITVEMPGITLIGSDVFRGCTSLTTIEVPKIPPSYERGAFNANQKRFLKIVGGNTPESIANYKAADDGNTNDDYWWGWPLYITSESPIITTTALKEGQEGSYYWSDDLKGTPENTIIWVIVGSLPPGLTLDIKTGVISGTPTARGDYNFKVIAENVVGKVEKDFSIKIKDIVLTTPTKENFNVSNLEITYNKTPQAVTVTAKNGITGMGNITVKYKDSENKIFTEAPTNAGKYSILVDLDKGTKYGPENDLYIGDFNIKPKSLTIKSIILPHFIIGDMTSFKVENPTIELLGLMVGDESIVEYADVYADRSRMGTYANATITGGKLSNQNYKLEALYNVEYTVIDKAVEGIAITSQPKVNYSYPQTLDLSDMRVTITYNNSTSDTNLSYSELESKGITLSKGHGANLTVSDTGSSIKLFQGSIEVNTNPLAVNKTSIAVAGTGINSVEALFDITDFSQTYDRTEKPVIIMPKDSITGMGDITVYYEASDYTKTTTPPTKAASYKILFDVAGGENFELQSGISAGSLEIAPKAITINNVETSAIKKGDTSPITLTNPVGEIEGMIGDDTCSITSAKASFDTSPAGNIINITIYDIGLSNSNYIFTGTLGIATDPDLAIVENANVAAEGAVYLDMVQAEAIDEDTIKNKLKLTATNAVNNEELNVRINKIVYTEAIAGTRANLNGTNGIYRFTVTISKGGQEQTTVEKTILIIATRFINPTKYTVTFAGGDGGTGRAPTQDETSEQETFILPSNTFTKIGYTFKGWNDGIKTYDEGATYTMPANNVIFVAQWIENIKAQSVILGRGIELNSSTPYWSNGEVSPSSTPDENGYNAYFDSANNTLTLKNAKINESYKVTDKSSGFTSEYYAGIYVESGDLNIILIGENEVADSSFQTYGAYAIRIGSNTVLNSNLIFDSKSTRTLIAKSKDSWNYWESIAGIYANSIIVNGGRITAIGARESNLSYGINASLTINGGKVISQAYNKQAFSDKPTVGESKYIKYVASKNSDGTDPVEYVPDAFKQYKYLEIELANSPNISNIEEQADIFEGLSLNDNLIKPSVSANGCEIIREGWEVSVDNSTDWKIVDLDSIATISLKGNYLRYFVEYRIHGFEGRIFSSNTVQLKIKAALYTVTFNSNEGSQVDPISNLVQGGTITLPTAPTKDGFTFEGWFTEVKWTNKFTASTPVTADITLYAKWKENVVVPVTLSSIAIKTPAIKLAYKVGEALDITGLVIEGTYSDGSKKDITISADHISGFNSSAVVASQTITVTVDRKTARYEIEILEASGKLQVASDAVAAAEAEKTNASKTAAQSLVDGLPDGPEKIALQNRLDSIKITEDPSGDEILAGKADELITKIPELSNITIDNKEEIQAARKAYEELTESQKALVENLAGLEAAEAKLAAIEKEIEAAEKLQAATNKVAAAELEKTNASKTAAQSLVDGLPDGPEKIALQERLDAIRYEIEGTVKNEAENIISGAKVKLMRGKNQIGSDTLTDSHGKFLIKKIPSGKYNMVITKDGITVTTLINVMNTNYAAGTIKLPKEKKNSLVEIKENTPDIIVGKLEEQFEDNVIDNDKGVTTADDQVLKAGGSVEIKLIAEKKDDKVVNASNISHRAESGNKTVGIFIDLSVIKTVKDSIGNEIKSQSSTLTELPRLIEVLIPLTDELQRKENYVVYRYHGDDVDIITTQANTDGEKITLIDNGKTIELSVKKFSTYAVAYEKSKLAQENDNSKDDDWDDKKPTNKETDSKINVEESKGGNTSISKDKKTATIIPDKGYVIVDVKIDGKSVGASEKYTFTDDLKHTITPIFVKENALSYYMKDNKKVYIGFSNISNNIYKSIIPEGVRVEFSENPKNFKDNTIAWAKDSIDFITQREILLGTSEDMFSPNESITRAMFVTAIGRLYEGSYGDISGLNSFSDVDENAYYGKYVGWANENKIIKGIGENKFAPNEKITREQMAVIMLNFAKILNKVDIVDSDIKYSDSESISSWAVEGAKYCQERKIIIGRSDGNFAPQENATRAEVAVVIERFIKSIISDHK